MKRKDGRENLAPFTQPPPYVSLADSVGEESELGRDADGSGS